MKVYATVTSKQQVHRLLRERAEACGRSRATLDELAGLAAGHAAMLLCDPPQKGLGFTSLFPLAGALGLAVALIEDPQAMEKMLRYPPRDEKRVQGRNHWRNAKALGMLREMAKKSGKIGGKARLLKISPKRRSQIARRAAKARWSKPRITPVLNTSAARP